MTKFDRTFQLIPLPFPFKVMQCAALIIHLFMSRCVAVCGHALHSPCCHEGVPEIYKSRIRKLSVFVAFEVRPVITRGFL